MKIQALITLKDKATVQGFISYEPKADKVSIVDLNFKIVEEERILSVAFKTYDGEEEVWEQWDRAISQ
jgi:hypothetical protein